jgi:hypothetical protein
MNKIRGKVLSLVLAAALVVSSFPATFASASSHKTVSGVLKDDPDQDTFYLVNGGSGDQLKVKDFDSLIYTGSVPLETKDHEEASDIEVSSISHVSGDRVVKWDISDDGDVTLSLRSSSSEGKEVIAVLYKGTYTDDDDNDITVKASTDITVHAVDKDSAVIGDATLDSDNDKVVDDDDRKIGKKSAELSDDFDAKTAANEISGKTGTDKTAPDDTDSKLLTVYRAEPQPDSALPKWESVKTVSADDSSVPADAYFTLKSSNNDIILSDTDTDTTHQYKFALTDGDQHSKGVDAVGDTTTYSLPDNKAIDAGADTLGISIADGKLVVDPVTNETEKAKIAKYVYIVAKTDAPADPTTSTSDTIGTVNETSKEASKALSDILPDTAADGETYQLKVLALTGDNEPAAVGKVTSAAISVKVVKGTAALAAADCPQVKKATDDDACDTLKVDYASSDATAKALTYKYTIQKDSDAASAETEIKPSDGTISIPHADATYTVKVTAYSGTTVKGYDIATVVVSHEVANDKSLAAVNAGVKAGASSGNVTFTAEMTQFGKDSKLFKDTKDVKVKVKINKTIKVTLDDQDNSQNVFNKLGKEKGKTYLYASGLTSDNHTKVGETREVHRINVSNYEVNFDGFNTDSTNGKVTVADKANVTKISGKVYSLTVSDGNVSRIDLDAGDVNVDDAKAGDIDTTDGTINVTSNATVGDLKCENDKTDSAAVKVESGKTGSITCDGTVELDATDDEYNIVTNDISCDGNVTINSEDSKITTGTIKPTSNNVTVTLAGDNVSIKGFDFDYRDATVECDDFQGTIPAPIHADSEGATLSTNDEDAKVTVTGDIDIDAISIDDESKVTFDGKVNVQDLDGAGTMVVKAGNLYIGNSAADTTLKLSDQTLAKGQTVFTAAHDNVDTDDITPFGYTLVKSEGKTTDTFKIDSLKFAGVAINKTSSKIAKGYSDTFTAGAYPGGTSLPTGYTIDWDLEDNDGIFELTKNKDGSASVKCVDYDKTFADENKATLVAKLIDADGDEDDDYDEAECNLTALETPAQKFISDTTGNKAMKLGQTYQFAITSTDGSKPSFAVASAGAAVSYAGASGNKYFFKVKAAKVGSYGVYAGGTKVAILVISSDVTLDTSKVTVKAGSSYQFEATAPKQPTFQVAGIGTIALRSHSGSNYYFKVTVPSKTAKGGHGVYVNGVRMAVLTVA